VTILVRIEARLAGVKKYVHGLPAASDEGKAVCDVGDQAHVAEFAGALGSMSGGAQVQRGMTDGTIAGATALVRMGGWSIGAFLAAPLMAGASITAPLIAGVGLKIVYDVALWVACRRVKPPEERGK